MKIIHCSREEIEREVVKELVDLISVKPKSVLGLPTGSTPIGIYDKLIEAYQNKKVSFKDVITFNLDEYIGLDESNINSYRYFMKNNLFKYIDINHENTNFPSLHNLTDYDSMITQVGGIDIQLLGLGSDGHIGFNEPLTSFDTLTHITNLDEQTIKDNSRFFNSIDEVPTKAITMGLKSIMNARKIILIVYGKNKEEIINKFLKSEITTFIPCSILKKHNDLTIYIEEDIKIY